MALCRSRQNVFCLSTLLFCVLFHAGSPQAITTSEVPRLTVQPVLTLKPDKIVVKTLEDTVKDLKISCSSPKPPDDRIKGIKKMTIFRNLLDPPPGVTNPQIIVKADVTSTTRDAQAVLSTSGYVYEGEVPLSENEGHIAITIKAATCVDSGSYFCDMVYYNSLARRAEHEVKVSSETALLLTDPLPVTLETDPDLTKVKCYLGQTVNITCTTNVGSVVDEEYTVMWQWSFRDRSAHHELWTKFDEKDKIADGRDIKESCSVSRSTSLTITLTLEDDERDYRCMVVRKYSETKIDTFKATSAIFPFRGLKESLNKWLGTYQILGIVFGLIALCCGAGFAIFWWGKRRKRTKAADAEVAEKKAEINERRRSLAMVVNKRMSMTGGSEIKNYGNILGKLNNPHDYGAASGVDDESAFESSVVDDESSIAPEDSSMASSEVSSISPPAGN
ncbi:uncharacterized protein [Littorina saxatilis]|uniref:uncharacterized protein n=1 Tax=Littorina saxatilis TaxID=31220 RepID=UPI0038B50E96